MRAIPVQLFTRSISQCCYLRAASVQDIELSSSSAHFSPPTLDRTLRANRPFANKKSLQDGLSNKTRSRTRSGGTNNHRPSNFRKPARQLLEHMSSSQILEKVLGGAQDARHWRTRIAKFRTLRLPILILQEIIRQEENESANRSGLAELIPTPEEMETMLKHPSLAGHSQKAIQNYVHVLRGETDEERCKRYLESPESVPLFIFHFLVRPSSGINDANTLYRMIESCHVYYDGGRTREQHAQQISSELRNDLEKALDIDRAKFNLIMRLLVRQCHRLEPRFVVKLADSAAQYIRSTPLYPGQERKTYITQCDLFNGCLQIFRPQPHLQVIQRSIPNAYFWEAQRILLSMSASLQKPLLVDRDGFRAIREVLSGQAKNHTEVHSSARHAPSWPPYLQPGDGMDERTDPEDNWSRTVSAGMLMQEAGFAKEEIDDAVDILQGMTLDGTPTIQQRGMVSKGRKIGVWEASIRATRNAQEAWDRFRNPPEQGMKPRLEQYTAMFEKLVLREVEPESRILPGDKALNFPTHHEANLAEFERARLRPPSISELYQHMRLNDVPPEGPCLRILVSNAASLETAHQYLRDSPGNSRVTRNLTAEEPDPSLLGSVPVGLFAAYIQVCLRVEGRHRNHQLMRVIQLTEARMSLEQSRWVPFIWGIILKELSQHHKALRISLQQQLNLMLRVTDTIGKADGVQLSTFTQFNKCVRKVTRRHLNRMFPGDTEDKEIMKSPMIQALYHQTHEKKQGGDVHQPGIVEKDADHDNASLASAAEIPLLKEARARIKGMFWSLADMEQKTQEHIRGYEIAALEGMNSRKDVVRSDHAHEYMLTLGYLGDYEEMGRLLEWLIQQWSQFDVLSALHEMDEAPPYAGFFETLCVFRLVAEPMLGKGTVSMVLQRMADSRLDWTWPDDAAVATYAEVHDDESINMLRRVVELARDRSKACRHNDATV